MASAAAPALRARCRHRVRRRLTCAVAHEVPKNVSCGTPATSTSAAAGPGWHQAHRRHGEHHRPRDREAHSERAAPIRECRTWTLVSNVCSISRILVRSLPARSQLRSPALVEPDALPVPLERLEAQLCEVAGHLAAATCRFLVLLAEFDERRGWASWEVGSCAAWLSWRCQMSSGTAREHVRVARALRDLPVIRGEFAAARLSYVKVRALTRIATPADRGAAGGDGGADDGESAGAVRAGYLKPQLMCL